jgi:flagellar biosynthetic protein FliO
MQLQALLTKWAGWPAWAKWATGLSAVLALGLGAILIVSGAGPAGSGEIGAADLAIRLLINLGIVLGLAYLSLWAYRRVTGGVGAVRQRALQVLESQRLSPRQAVHLIRVGERVLLVGATDGGLSTLADVSADLPVPTAAGAPAVVTASELFESLLARTASARFMGQG